jgi:transposase
MIAVPQARGLGSGKAYLDKQLAAGKTCTEALRLLCRHLRRRFPCPARRRAPPARHRDGIPAAA